MMLYDYIKDYAIDWVIHYKERDYIDKYNIFKANYHAMHEAIDKLLVRPEHILLMEIILIIIVF